MNGVVRPATERSEKTARPTKAQKREKNSEGLKATWREICHRQKGLMTLMIMVNIDKHGYDDSAGGDGGVAFCVLLVNLETA